jgi:mutator protein MutT
MSAADVHIAIAVVEWDGQFLVGTRPHGTPLAGCAEFPGGKIRPGETATMAARRECLEETGVDVEVTRLLETVSHQYAHGAFQLHFFHCHPSATGPPRAPFCWVARQRLASLSFPAANAKVIERLTYHAE